MHSFVFEAARPSRQESSQAAAVVKVLCVEREAVQNACRVARIARRQDPVAERRNGLEMPDADIASGADDGEIQWPDGRHGAQV